LAILLVLRVFSKHFAFFYILKHLGEPLRAFGARVGLSAPSPSARARTRGALAPSVVPLLSLSLARFARLVSARFARL
jgi:hypothetical protein